MPLSGVLSCFCIRTLLVGGKLLLDGLLHHGEHGVHVLGCATDGEEHVVEVGVVAEVQGTGMEHALHVVDEQTEDIDLVVA